MYDDPWEEANYPLHHDAELRERLIGGGCARVVVLSPLIGQSMLDLYFPQGLGLPPVRRFARNATRDELELAELAAEATRPAAADRWIAEGEVWAEYFLARAEAVVSVETDWIDFIAGPRRPRPPRLDLDRVWKWIRSARDKRRHRSALDLLPLATASRTAMKPTSLAIAEDEYPEKLIRVTSRAQVRALRKVRAAGS
ncbi:hypothetical protein [Catenulispora pinisilvae]|uniref:hypothetical protein n=1 Tax=Catenulispora pinisilvae TaxID=2705253 RepID=UPI0018913C0D|nr:hypothetical protein [Catenulispora pinisilvae]